MVINRIAIKSKRVTIRLPEKLERSVAQLQKRLHHASTSRTFRHLIEKGIEIYNEPKKVNKNKKTG